jgi:hypothetical protein
MAKKRPSSRSRMRKINKAIGDVQKVNDNTDRKMKKRTKKK